MKRAVWLLVFLVLIHAGWAQHGANPGPGIRNINGFGASNPLYSNGSYIGEKGADVQGNPYLYEEWLMGSIVLDDGERFDSLLLRLVLVNNELQMKLDDKEYKFNVTVKEFQLAAPDTRYRKFRSGYGLNKDANDKSFYEVLYDGKTQLLVKRKKQIVAETTNVPGLKTKQYEENISYFLYLPGSKLEKIKKNSKSIVNVLGNKQQKIESFIDKERLDLTKDEDIIKLLQYYDGNS